MKSQSKFRKSKPSKSLFSPGIPLAQSLGILGGGQLAQMLAHSAQRQGHRVAILSESAQDPAAQVTGFWQKGSPLKSKSLESFFKSVQIVTFESEFYPADLMEQIAKKTKTELFPSAACMKILQDRALQKNLLDENKIPTADYVVVHSMDEIKTALNLFGKMVLKKRLGGYDGYGTYIIQSAADLQRLDPQIILSPGLIAEKWMPFQQELAAIFVRSKNREKLALPLVRSHQSQSKCDWVMGPMRHKTWAAMQKKIFRMLDEMTYVGALGVEFFDLGSELIVNEIAPRVHNSGHYSMEALNFSQFDLHWMAGLGQPLPKLEFLSKAFVMTNLIGTKETQNMTCPQKITGRLHWYGKTTSRPGRKMGHVNYIGNHPKALLKKALQERKAFQL